MMMAPLLAGFERNYKLSFAEDTDIHFLFFIRTIIRTRGLFLLKI